MMTWVGSIMVTSIQVNQNLRLRNRTRDKA